MGKRWLPIIIGTKVGGSARVQSVPMGGQTSILPPIGAQPEDKKEVSPTQPATQPAAAVKTPGTTPLPPPVEKAEPIAPVEIQPLTVEVDVIAEAMPLLDEELKKD